MTFSIVAADPATGDVGVAVASKFLAVGAVVPWARAGAGAVATQSWADVTFGPRGLDLLAAGHGPEAVIEQLLADDAQRETRQVGIARADGHAASFSGASCMDWAGSQVGTSFTAQGNILTGPEVVEAMATVFEQTSGEPLARRLFMALQAGDGQGGDQRGRQSAALLVARPRGGYGGNHDRYLDLRVDDYPRPVEELGRLLDLHRLYFDRPESGSVIRVGDGLRTELEGILDTTGRGGDRGSFGNRLYGLIATENLEERWVDAEHLDPLVLDFLRGLDAPATD